MRIAVNTPFMQVIKCKERQRELQSQLQKTDESYADYLARTYTEFQSVRVCAGAYERTCQHELHVTQFCKTIYDVTCVFDETHRLTRIARFTKPWSWSASSKILFTMQP